MVATTNRPSKKVRIDSNTTKPRARFADPDTSEAKPPKKKSHETTHPTRKDKGKAKETSSNAETFQEILDLPNAFKIVAGSYEKLLYGLEGKTTYSEGTGLQFHLKAIFAFPAHVSCIKAVAASPQGGKWLASGSADEIIKVWDLRRKKEIGGLMHHEGSITHLVFPSRSHLFSASEDGTLCLFHARDWTVLRSLKGHKGRVNSIAVHPSGKVALSVGKDRALRMWDLMRGKGVASTKLGKEGEIVRWSVDGKLFVVQSGSTIDIYNTELTLLHTVQHPSRLHDVTFCKRVSGEGEVLLVAAEDKKLSIYDIPEDSSRPPITIAQMVGHGNRVKAIQTLKIALPLGSGRKSTTVVTTVSSDGKIRLYDMNSIPETKQAVPEIQPVAEYDTNGTRLTCVTIADGDDIKPLNGKRRREEDGDDSDGDGEVKYDEIISGDGELEENEEESEED